MLQTLPAGDAAPDAMSFLVSNPLYKKAAVPLPPPPPSTPPTWAFESYAAAAEAAATSPGDVVAGAAATTRASAVFIAPPAPAPGWTVKTSRTGKMYYVNALTGVTAWQLPTAGTA
jgi:hypothetical protein